MTQSRLPSLLNLWGMPLLLAFLTMFGLLSALLGTGAWHYLSWLALAIPLMVVAWHTFRPQPRRLPITAKRSAN